VGQAWYVISGEANSMSPVTLSLAGSSRASVAVGGRGQWQVDGVSRATGGGKRKTDDEQLTQTQDSETQTQTQTQTQTHAVGWGSHSMPLPPASVDQVRDAAHMTFSPPSVPTVPAAVYCLGWRLVAVEGRVMMTLPAATQTPWCGLGNNVRRRGGSVVKLGRCETELDPTHSGVEPMVGVMDGGVEVEEEGEGTCAAVADDVMSSSSSCDVLVSTGLCRWCWWGRQTRWWGTGIWLCCRGRCLLLLLQCRRCCCLSLSQIRRRCQHLGVSCLRPTKLQHVHKTHEDSTSTDVDTEAVHLLNHLARLVVGFEDVPLVEHVVHRACLVDASNSHVADC